MTALAVLVLALVPVAQPPAGAKTGSIQVLHSQAFTPEIVTVELYHDGKQIRGRELVRSVGNSDPTKDNSVTWDKLATGKYEVHFCSSKKPTFVKKLFLGDDDMVHKVVVEFDDKPVTVGGGVSLAELAETVAKLKKEIDDLKAEVEKLKKK